MTKEKILVVEDEAGIRELIQLYLKNRNYNVDLAENGEKALELLDKGIFDLVLLDIEMPGIDGFEVCQKIRKTSDLPIIFISSRRDVMDKINCFELGGDDYITKPFDFAELEARIQANLRRFQHAKKQSHSSNIIEYANLTYDLNTFECFLRGEPIQLSKKENEVLSLLLKHPNQVFSAEQIYDRIWGVDSLGDIQTVKVHIRNLRRKLEEDPSNPEKIITVRGFGYRFIA